MKTQTKDAQALTYAAEVARDRVLFDPTDDEIVQAVEEYTCLTIRYGSRLYRAVVQAYDATNESDDDAAIRVTVKRLQSRHGLC